MLVKSLAAVVLFSMPLAAQNVDTTATKAALMQADRALAHTVSSKGAEAFLDALDTNGAVLFPRQEIMTAKDVRAAFLSRYASPSSYSWNPVHAVASTDGTFGCTFGYSLFRNAADTASQTHRGDYVTCWKKGSDGKWKVAGTQRNDSPPQPPLTADSATLAGGPHSATFASGANPLRSAQDADSLFAVMGFEPAGPGPAFMKYSAEDAMLLGGPEFPRGPQQIADAFKGYPADRVITWRPAWALGAGSGGLAFTVGNSVSGPRAGKTGPSNPGKYFTVWRQEPDGRWLYIFDLGSPRPVQ